MQHPQAILTRLGISARKSLSQNFLTSDYWADKLAKVALDERPERIIEIGPGLGALTSRWAKRCKDGVIIEYDRALASFLREEHPNVTLIESDVLRVDLRALCPPSIKTVVISNLPYHISSPIFFSFIEAQIFPHAMILTFQKEFADRLAALPKSPDYGALSVLSQTFFDIEPIGVLPAGAFYPKPGPSSSALLIRPRSVTVSPARLKTILRASFAHRRKLLSSNLQSLTTPERVTEIMNFAGVPPKARAEELTKEQYWQMVEAMQ
ncbi:MAG: ribosomal RNA small subunit methyltransferase A [Deltaproteobacteria bacterium]|nr:ribosomal RNA small subunit methyltransferase A [Deltaproteobacteria bacterium]